MSRKSKSQGFYFMPSPFEEMTEMQKIELLTSLGQDAASKFEEELKELFDTLLNIDPILLLSSFAYYGLSHDGITPEWDRPIKVTQHHVELLQAFLLIQDGEAFGFQPVVGDIFPTILKSISTLSLLFSFRRFEALASTTDQLGKQKLSIQEYMRNHTQVARNWGYPQQIQNTVIKLFQPLDNEIEQSFGIRIEHLVNMSFNLIETIEERVNSHDQKLRQALKGNKVSRIAERYSELFMDREDDEEFLGFLRANNLNNVRDVRAILLSHSDLFLPDLYTLNLDDFVEAYQPSVQAEDLERVVDGWSFRFGELSDSNVEYFFMDNPIWEKPLIKLNEATFFCPVPGLFISFCVELMESLIRGHQELWQRYEKCRGEFLESEICSQFKLAFPEAKIYRGSQWHDPEDNAKEYENDVLIIFDTTAFVIEAKSGKVRPSSRRGAPLALEEDIKKLIVDAAVQANRFIDFLRQNPIYEFRTRHGETNHVDVSHVKYFQPFNITFELLGAIGAHLPSLQKAGLANEELSLIPSMSLADLEIIFEILTDTTQKIHYFQWRTQLEQQSDFMADEIDLLAVYVTDQFHASTIHGRDYVLNMYGESERLNPYFLRDYHKKRIAKPSRKMINWWRDILQRLEQRHIQGWTELGAILLGLSYPQQQQLQKSFRVAFRKMQKSSKDFYNYTVISGVATPIILFGYRQMSVVQRNDLATRIAQDVMQKETKNQALMIGIDADREKVDYPYSFLAMLFPGSSIE